MTSVSFLLREGNIVGFVVTGHTGRAAAGHDILCAAISSAAYLTANTITDVIGAEAKIEVSDGRMLVLAAPEWEERCRVTLKGFERHIAQLRKQYPKNLRIMNITTGKEHYYA